MSAEPSPALRELGERLLAEGTPISAHVVRPSRAWDQDAGGAYQPVIEAVREGYLLHYEEPRLLAGHDDDLGVLAGDYLYALGIQRLAALGDWDAVLALANLIGDCAERHSEGREDEVPGLWREAVAGIGDETAASQ